MHHDATDGPKSICKKTLISEAMSLDEVKNRMKMWLLMGEGIGVHAPDARTQHRQCDVTNCDVWDAELIEELCPPVLEELGDV